jgi:hypothetical protein
MFHQKGDLGRILLGVDIYLHDVLETETREHLAKMLPLDKQSSIRWHLSVVYGPAQIEDKGNFLIEFAL